MPPILLTVYPDECDAFGHLNQASFLSLFERARWEMLRAGPGMDVFDRTGAWPAVRSTVIEYHAAAYPGDVLRFEQDLTHVGRTSFTMRQAAHRSTDDALIATAEFVFVCVSRNGRPVPVPEEFNEFMAARRRHRGELQRLAVNGVTLAVEVRGDGPAALFIHGYPFDHTIWTHQVAALEGWCRIAPDLRGMGQSDAPDLGYSMETYAADLAALLDLLGARDVVLVRALDGGVRRLRVPAALAGAGAGAGARGYARGGRYPRRPDGSRYCRRDRPRSRRRGHRRRHAPQGAGRLDPGRACPRRWTG